MTRAWIPRVCAALFVVGLVGGTALDRPVERPPTTRAGYRVLEADFHAHTRFSDGFLSPFDLVVQARRRGLDVLAVTEHNNVFPAYLARWYSRRVGGPTILIGEEVTTNRFHLHGIGLTERVNPNQSVRGVLADIHRQGGIAIAAHPVKRFWETFEPVRDQLDGAEVLHPIAFQTQRGPGWRWAEMRDFYVNARAAGYPLTAVASSDYHFFSPLGVCRTLLFAKDDGEASVLEALKRGRTVVYDLAGEAYGDPAMIEALVKEPYTPRTQDYDYHGGGGMDRTLRTVGWLGLLGLVLFRRSSPRKDEA